MKSMCGRRGRGQISFGGMDYQSGVWFFACACRIGEFGIALIGADSRKRKQLNKNMSKGRKALSDEQKRLRGTDQPCRMKEGNLPAVVQHPNGTLATIPKTKLKGTAKKVYTLVATELASRGALDILSTDLVVAYCREMALYHDMMSDLEKEGMTIELEGKNDAVITQINPKRKIAEGALSAAKTLATEFGLTPASRARVMALFMDNAPKDDFADFEQLDLGD